MLSFIVKRLGWLLVLLSPCLSQAQQDPIFTQNLFQILPFNPAYAGSKGGLSGIAMYRNQWTDVEGHPQNGSFSIHSPIGLSPISIGVHANYDEIGVSQRYDGALALSYKLALSPTFNLNFGLQGLVEYEETELSSVNVNNPLDPSFSSDLNSKLMPNVGAGLYLYSERYVLSLSSPTLLKHSSKFERLASDFQRHQHFYAMTGYLFDLNDIMKLRASVLGRYVQGAPIYGDLNATIIWYESLWTGISLRSTEVIALMAQLRLGQSVWVGYGYDHKINNEEFLDSPTHEVMIGFTKPGSQTTFKTPRYF